MDRGRDPVWWCAIVAGLFAALASYGLLSPASPYFDETHYVPAARSLLRLELANPEHPLFGKEMIAAAIAVLGDRALAWRLPALLFGTLGLFAFGRLMWWTSRRRFATIAATILLATNVLWFIQSRIAMLDIFAAAMLFVGLWQVAAAMPRQRSQVPPQTARLRLAVAGVSFGLALGAKWSVAPLLPLPAVTIALLRLRAGRSRPVAARLSSVIEPLLLLGLLPLCVYWATFAPAFFYSPADAVPPFDIVGQTLRMLERQSSLTGTHPYQSVWHQWVLNLRPVWYLYENIDGAQRGVLLLGNPFTMLAGLAALAVCCWTGWRERRADMAAFALLYLVALGFWIVAAKPIQFYYHYLVPAALLMGCLALALDALHARGGAWRWTTIGALAGSVAMFGWFYPIVSAIPLPRGPGAFETWMWLESWR